MVRWHIPGDRGSKEFFEAIRMRATRTSIMELVDCLSQIQTQHGQLETVCSNFYTNLYAQRPDDLAHSASQQWVFDGLHSRITLIMAHSLSHPPNLSKLYKVLMKWQRANLLALTA